MRFRDTQDTERKAAIRISLDGDLNTRDLTFLMKSASFFYRLNLFCRFDDLEVRIDQRSTISRLINLSSPRTLTTRPLNLELLANLGFVTSKDIRYALLSPSIPVGIEDGPEVNLKVDQISYASPGYVVLSGVASAVESIFKAFSSILSLRDRRIDRRIKEEELYALMLDNYGKLHELKDRYGITPEEVNLVRSEGSILVFQMLEAAQKGQITKVNVARRATDEQFEEA